MRMSPDGRWLVRSVITGRTLRIQGGAEFCPSGSAVEVWGIPGPGQTPPGGPALSLQTGKPDVYGLAFRSDGKVLAAASHSQGAFLWEIPTGKEVHARWLPGPQSLEG